MKTALKRTVLVVSLFGAGSLLAYGLGLGGPGSFSHHSARHSGMAGHMLGAGYGPGAFIDPDVDARGFLWQNIWYSQGLQAFAWSKAGKLVPLDQPATDFNGNPFFTDGFRLVLWFSGEPYSLLDTTPLNWDEVRDQ